MSTFATDMGDIIVEGTLKDDRLIPYYRPSGALHTLSIT